MAHRAINRVLLGFVVFCSVILNLMAGDAIGWRIEDRSFVAGRALSNTSMSAGELKASGGMVERRWLPSGRGVARLALYRYASGNVVRIYGSGIVGGVAGVTIPRRSCKTRSMALGAGGSSMNTR